MGGDGGRGTDRGREGGAWKGEWWIDTDGEEEGGAWTGEIWELALTGG